MPVSVPVGIALGPPMASVAFALVKAIGRLVA
jgi:hypothetical protein